MEVEVSSWSPDGQRIAFMGREHGKKFRIFLVHKDGSEAKEAVKSSDNQGGPSWSPDGEVIVYGNVYGEETQTGWIRRINLATRKVEILAGSHNFRTARWSPDGKYIAALQPVTHELMLFDVHNPRWRVLASSIMGDNINWTSDSQSIYADSFRGNERIIERVRVKDGKPDAVIRLASLQKMSGQLGSWIGVTPDNSPIVFRFGTSSEIYELKLAER